MSSGKRLKKAREYTGLTQSEFGEIFSLKWDKIKNIETETHKLKPEFAEKIEEKLFISGWWLLTGKGDMLIDKENKTSNVSVNNSNNVAVNNGNGTITINTSDYVDSNEVKELLELLKDTPKSWIHNIIERLKKSLNAIDDFK